jgi:hypothetical protein
MLVLSSLAQGDQKKAESGSDKPYARCVKILKFGQLNEFYEPAKSDAEIALGLLGEERAVPVLIAASWSRPRLALWRIRRSCQEQFTG